MKSPLQIVLAIAGVIVAAAIALAYAAYRRDIGRAFARISTGSQVAQMPCGPIEYATAGAGEPMLVVHGAGGGFDQGMYFAQDLAASTRSARAGGINVVLIVVALVAAVWRFRKRHES